MPTSNNAAYKEEQRERRRFPGQNLGFIPERAFKGPPPSGDAVRGASGGQTARRKQHFQFFLPTHYVYGYRDEESFTLKHSNVVSSQRLSVVLKRSTLVPVEAPERVSVVS